MTQPSSTSITSVGFCSDCDAVTERGGREVRCSNCNKRLQVEGWFETVTTKEEDPIETAAKD